MSLHYAFQTSHHLVLVLQYCSGGDLQKKLHQESFFEESTARLYSAEVLTALVHLHERFIVYRDLKPENVVLDGDGHCLLTDFGLSKEGVAEVTQSFCGSLAFLAPEVLANRGHGHTVDIYGLGVLLFAMLTGRPPFYDRSRDRLISNIQAATLHVPPYVSQAATALIRATMKRDPNDRLGFRKTTDVQSHYFYASMDFDALLRREVPVPAQMPVPAPIRQQTDAPISPFEPSRDGRFWRGWRWCAYLRGDTPDRSTTAGSRNINGWDFSRVPGN
jgi:serine/threonine protein kinase